MRDKLNVLIISRGQKEIDDVHKKLLGGLMSNQANIMFDMSDSVNTVILEYLKDVCYHNITLYYSTTGPFRKDPKDDIKPTMYSIVTYDYDNKDDASAPLNCCDVCVVFAIEDHMPSHDLFGEALNKYKKPVNMILTNTSDVDVCLIPSSFNRRLGYSMTEGEALFWKYINIRSKGQGFPELFTSHGTMRYDFEGDVMAVNPVPQPETSPSPCVFVGGSCDVTGYPAYWDTLLDILMRANCHILVGDAPGTDSYVQTYLSNHQYQHVTVYTSEDIVRNNVGGWDVEYVHEDDAHPKEDGYWSSHMPKDVVMSNKCDYGVFLWNGYSRATAKNLWRLASMRKKAIVCNDSVVYPVPDDIDPYRIAIQCVQYRTIRYFTYEETRTVAGIDAIRQCVVNDDTDTNNN